MAKKDRMLKIKLSVFPEKKLSKLLKIPRIGLSEIVQNKEGTIYFSSNKKILFELVGLEWDGPEYKETQVTTTKKKGTLGRAVTGGLLAGPIGALAGASTAKSNSETNTYKEERSKYGDLHLFRLDTNEPLTINILIKSSQAEVIYQMLEYAGVEPETPTEEQPEKSTDPIAQLRDYKQLLDEGIITQDEFDTKKKQLLDITE